MVKLNQDLTISFKLCDEPQIPFELAEDILEELKRVFIDEYERVTGFRGCLDDPTTLNQFHLYEYR